ncbi:hypothetical protein BDZ90DRAFT_229822 [Jaminaea rosea]|uniref:SET domain-containing protein n=1 Tax=Jaminaea rosea TaxID=1569628 RepID=A0A316V5W9_9BASI|nr:hypothetical protein BDZ90DRAFT_229822 [Jaminaea rosea]PWN30825.1 hypothetical protein BDZ90DRAFT_229822 [Jaminaea rosea]
MDALLTSLRALSLLPPSPSQLLQLLASPSSPEEEEKESRDLARVLSLGSYDPDNDGTSEDAGAAGLGIDRELIEDGVVEMIRSFRKEVAKMRSAYEAEENQRQAPTPLPAKGTPLHFLKLRHDSLLRQTEKLDNLYGGYRPRVTFSGGPSFSSELELADLKPVERKDQVLVGGRLDGHYMVARVASTVAIYVGATFLVTLPQPLGFSLPISISHFTPDPSLSSVAASQSLPEGTLLALKEPYLSPHHSLRAAGSSGGMGIRVDTPTDVIVLDEGHALLKGLEWPVEPSKPPAGRNKKAKGAASEEPKSADIASSSSGPQSRAVWLQDGPQSRRALGERSSNSDSRKPASSDSILSSVEVLLGTDRPGAAWRELQAASSILDLAQHDPSRYHELRGDVLYSMSAWEQAVSAYRAAGLSCADKLQAASLRGREALHGPDDTDGSTVSSVYFSHLSSPSPRIDLADWLSPSLRVAQIPNAGRGLVTTRPVPAGTPLLMAKSRGSSYPSDKELEHHCPVLRCDFENGVISTTTQVLATSKLIHLMIDRPELTQEILGLTAGPKMKDSRWVEAERFEKARAPMEQPWDGLDQDRMGPRGGINALYVDEVLRHNAFGPGTVRRQGDEGDEKGSGSKSAHANASRSSLLPPALHRKLSLDPPSAFSRSTQPHPLPAILNHSCLPNVSSVFLGDVVITRALRDLREGEEIGHEYVRGGVDYAARQDTLKKHGFVCRCALCDLDRGDGMERLGERRKLFAVRAPAIFSRSDALLRHTANGVMEGMAEQDREKHEEVRESLQELEAELMDTYGGERRGKLRPEMRETLERIARHAVCERKLGLALRYYLRSLQSVNAVLKGEWERVADDGEEEEGGELVCATQEKLTIRGPDDTAPPVIALTQCPALHVDEAQRTLWRISQLYLLSPSSSSHSHHLSLVWSRTAYWVHSILIGGGYDVFRDRWGPTSAEEEESLEWKEAWRLWNDECGRPSK